MSTGNHPAIRPETTLEIYEMTPRDVIARAKGQADALMEIVEAKQLFTNIGGKKFLEAEAWETILAFNYCAAQTESLEPVYREGELVAYRAKVNLVDTRTGVLKGAAIMDCGMDEFPTRGKEGYAKDRAAMSTAETWAMAKAARMNFSWVAVLGGYEPTPADEMRHVKPDASAPKADPSLFCTTHQTVWFKKGVMRGYAHKIGGTASWCNKPAAKPAPLPQDTASAPATASGGANPPPAGQEPYNDATEGGNGPLAPDEGVPGAVLLEPEFWAWVKAVDRAQGGQVKAVLGMSVQEWFAANQGLDGLSAGKGWGDVQALCAQAWGINLGVEV